METKTEPKAQAPAPQTPHVIPEWAIHISEVYKWAEKPRRFGGRLTKRTIQWYSSSGLLPSPKRIGKEAYYDRHTIFSYLRVIEILNRKFGLLLSEIQKIIRKAETLDEFVQTGGICLGPDEEGHGIMEHPVVVLSTILEEFLEYEENEISQADSTVDGPDLSPEQAQRLEAISSALVKGLRSSKKEFEQVICGGVLQLEEKLFPKGKVFPKQAQSNDLEEVPF